MLKKQTVWLLTMLSLMIVLSVYYMISPDSGDFAYVNEGQTESQEASSTSSEAVEQVQSDVDVDEMTNITGDELFTKIRMELQDERSMTVSRMEEIVASGNASVDEKDEALQTIDEIEEVSTKEAILEQSILSANDYQDVLVRSEDGKVHVHVKADELSDAEVVNIMQMVRDEFGDITSDVIFQPTDAESKQNK